jgi:hypothetical protein
MLCFWFAFIVLIAALVASLPVFPHSRTWGYTPSALVLLLLVLLFFLWYWSWLPTYPAPESPTDPSTPVVPQAAVPR